MHKTRLLLFALTLAQALQGAFAAPKVGVMQWPKEDNPIWGPRLEAAMRRVLEADTTFGGAPDIEAMAERRHFALASGDFLDGGASSLSPLFGVDQWVKLEWNDAPPMHQVIRARWMPWKAQETWALPLRMTVWEGKTGRVSYSGIISGDETKKGSRFWPYRDYGSFSFFEREALREKLMQVAVLAARDTLARLVGVHFQGAGSKPGTNTNQGVETKKGDANASPNP